MPSDADAAALGEPPSLAEPLLRLNSSGIQSAVAWVHNVVTSLAANIEAERSRQSLTEDELRAEDRQLRDRIERLERSNLASFSAEDAQQQGAAEATSNAEYALDLKRHADRARHFEEQLENLRDQLAQRLGTQEDLLSMRLDTIERELLSCVRPAALDGIRAEIEEARKRMLEGLPDTVRSLGSDLQAELKNRAEDLQKDLKAISEAVDAKLKLFDAQMESITKSLPSADRPIAADVNENTAASSAQIATATAQMSRDLGDLEVRMNTRIQDRDLHFESRIKDRDLHFEGRIQPLETLHGAHKDLEGRMQELEQKNTQGIGERRLSNRSLEIDGEQLLSGLATSPRASSPSHKGEGGQEFSELASRVDGALDGMSKRLVDIEQRVADSRTAQSTELIEPAKLLDMELPQLMELARHVDTSLDNMSRRLTALEEGGFITGPDGEQPLSAEDAKRLVAEAAEKAAAASANPPASLLSEFSNRMDTSLSEVTKRIGNLEQHLGALQEGTTGTQTEENIGEAAPEALLGELATSIDTQLAELQRKIEALEQLAEQQRLARPQSAPVQEISARMAEVERRLDEMARTRDVAVGTEEAAMPASLPANILESIQHELESAKARIELQLGQDLETKTAAVEQRLTESHSSHVAAVQERMSSVEAAVESVEVKSRELVLPAVETRSRELILPADPEGTPPSPQPVSSEDFTALSEQVVAMQPQIQEAVAAAVAAKAAAERAASVSVAAGTGSLAAQQAEQEKRTEQRMTAMWTELAQHAENAATRVDNLERNIFGRVDKIEANAGKNEAETRMNKSLEWMNWRISWLEWATKGEKRSFSRSVDAKGVLPSPPPSTMAATGFDQPVTEDMELWARDRGGRLRLRREVRAPPQSFADLTGGPNGPVGGRLGASASLGALPKLRQ